MDQNTQLQILRYIKHKIAVTDDPRILGKPLAGNLSGFWRYRVDKYRIICQLQYDTATVMVVFTGKRDSVYSSDLLDNKTLH
ncbi:MAG: type II toxin-antitoxin system RelE/ParE family toxin [Pseudomonadota bacterium]